MRDENDAPKVHRDTWTFCRQAELLALLERICSAKYGLGEWPSEAEIRATIALAKGAT